MTAAAEPSDDIRRAWRTALIAAAALTVLRLVVLFVTPLELYPDEAQYWLWSRELDFGYVSKPPLIAWLIWATTQVGGNAEAFVRLSAPLLHAVAMLAIFKAAARLYDGRTALLAALLYGLMPGVQISALFIATDAPLLCFLALAQWAYVALVQAEDAGGRRRLALALGAALGLAFMAKLAAVYVLAGLVLHAALDRRARTAWRGPALPLALGALAVTFGPNILWQAQNKFATASHLTEVNAAWSLASMVNPGELLKFVTGQLGVIGPIPLVVLGIGLVLAARRRRLGDSDKLLLCLAAPAFAFVLVQAFVSHARAHWAAAAYPAAVVLIAAWLERWRARRWTGAALALQGLVAAIVLLAIGAPQVVDALGHGRRLQRIRGWAETARFVTAAARAAGPLSAVAVEERYLFNELAYYGRDYFQAPGAPPLRMRPPEVKALNEAELAAPLQPHEGARALIAETVGRPPEPKLPEEFASARLLGRQAIPLGGTRTREIELYLAEGYVGPVNRPTPP